MRSQEGGSSHTLVEFLDIFAVSSRRREQRHPAEPYRRRQGPERRRECPRVFLLHDRYTSFTQPFYTSVSPPLHSRFTSVTRPSYTTDACIRFTLVHFIFTFLPNFHIRSKPFQGRSRTVINPMHGRIITVTHVRCTSVSRPLRIRYTAFGYTTVTFAMRR